MIVRFLGTHNAESRDTRLISFLIDDVLAVEAGSLVSELSFVEQKKIKAFLLSHGHYDHIRGVPAFAFNNSQHEINVFAVPKTLEILTSHLVDGIIYPNFTEKNSFLKKPVLKLCPLEPFKPYNVEGYQVLAIPVNHPVDTVGFEVTSPDGKRIFYTADTGPGLLSVWENTQPHLIIADVTYPNRLAHLANDAGHLCPQMLKAELVEFCRVKGYLPQVTLVHLSPQLEEEIRGEVAEVAEELKLSINIAGEGERLII